MHKYKELKAAEKMSVRKQEAVAASFNEDGSVKSPALNEELQLVKKMYNSDTGEAMDDSIRSYSLPEMKREIDRCKADISRMQDQQAEWEQLEKDLKAL